MVRIDLSGAKEFTPNVSNEDKALDAIRKLKDGSGAGSDFIGWVDLPVSYDKDEFARIQKAAKKIQSDSKALVVIGIGGSYLGARAVIELLKSPNYNMLQKSTPDIYFAGNGISSDALTEIIAMIGARDRVPYFQGASREEIRQGRRARADLRHDRQGKGCAQDARDQRRLRDLRRARRCGRPVLGPDGSRPASHRGQRY